MCLKRFIQAARWMAIGSLVLLAVMALLGNVLTVEAQSPNPHLFVQPHEDNAGGRGWPEGATVTLTIDDPSTLDSPDYADTGVVTAAPWDPGDTSVEFDLRDIFDVQPGHIVTLTDGITTKEHVVTGLTIASIDRDADIITGTANPGAGVHIWACTEDGCPSKRNVLADAAGNWAANFSVPADGEYGEVFDIGPNTGGGVTEFDDDGDETQVSWYISNPRFDVEYLTDFIDGYDWPVGAQVTLTIDDPGTPEQPDYTETITAIPWEGDETRTQFDLFGDFDIQPGHIVTLSDGFTVKDHVVANLSVTAVDVENDTVSGTAYPGATIEVRACGEDSCANRDTAADGAGNWTEDLSVPGDEDWEQETVDIGPGSYIAVDQPDDDDDNTSIRIHVPAPRLDARPDEDIVEGWEWAEGSEVTLTIDDPSTPESPDYMDIQTVTSAPWNPDETWVRFEFGGMFDVQPGYIVTLTDGAVVKEHVVTDSAITEVDPDADTVSGTAAPGVEVDIWACDDDRCANREEVADAAGSWMADFSVPGDEDWEQETFDITLGSRGGANERDDDGDATQINWHMPNPHFAVNTDGRVEGWQWSLGTSVTLTIDDPSTSENPDYTDTQIVTTSPWNTEETRLQFEFQSVFDVRPGHIVTLTDGVAVKEHVVTDLTVAAIDLDADTISGTANPGAEVEAWICDNDGCIRRGEVVDGLGNWTVDFSVPGSEDNEQEIVDIVPGTDGNVQENDDDGDATQVNWRVPNPHFWVNPGRDLVEGWEWPLGASVTIAIDDPGTLETPDYTDTQVAVVSPWDPASTYVVFELRDVFDIELGYIVTMTDGAMTKGHVVTDLTITLVDPDTDLVYGTAAPGVVIGGVACDSTGCAWREATVAAGGTWALDFSTPGQPGSWGETPWDIVPGNYVRVSQSDSDGDETATIWSWTANKSPTADAGLDLTVIVGEAIVLDGSGSYDSDGTIVSYEWDFGDGDTGSGETVTHVYAAAGEYEVVLTVIDDDGASSTDAVIILVQMPEDATRDLVSDVEEMELPGGLEPSLTSKLDSAIDSLERDNVGAAVNQLNAFINQVEAQRGKKLTGEQVDELIAEAQRIIDGLQSS